MFTVTRPVASVGSQSRVSADRSASLMPTRDASAVMQTAPAQAFSASSAGPSRMSHQRAGQPLDVAQVVQAPVCDEAVIGHDERSVDERVVIELRAPLSGNAALSIRISRSSVHFSSGTGFFCSGSAEASASIRLLVSPMLVIGMSRHSPSSSANSRSRGDFSLRMRFELLELALVPRLEHRVEQVKLRGKIRIEAADADAGALGDLLQRGAVIAALGIQIIGAVEDRLADLLFLDLHHGALPDPRAFSGEV